MQMVLFAIRWEGIPIFTPYYVLRMVRFITVQTHSNMESHLCYLIKKEKVDHGDVIFVSVL